MSQKWFYCIRLWLVRSVRLILFLFLLFLPNVESSNATEKIVLQLAWKHQFQFAGYYAALQNGLYKEAGLDVTIVEGGEGKFAREEVLHGRAQYGIAGSELILHRKEGDPFVVLAPIFQHSASILLARKDHGISNMQDLIGKRVMLLPGDKDADILVALLNEGINSDAFQRLDQSYNLDDLIQGRTHAVSAYSTNEPWHLLQKQIEPSIISPQTYGVDFYSDCLFTTQGEIENHPHRVKAFLEASLLGWKYAMDNPEEVIELLLKEYGVHKDREHLRFEAEEIRKIMMPDLVQIGHLNPGRWQHIRNTYARLGLINADFPIEEFLYNPHQEHDYTWLKRLFQMIVPITLGLVLFICILLFFNRKLSSQVYVRKQIETELKKSETLLREAQRVAKIGHWELDSISGTSLWSDEIFHMFDLDPKESEPAFAAHKDLIHMVDWDSLEVAIYELSSVGKPFNLECRIQRSSGDIGWMHVLGSTEKDENGHVTRMFGTAQDITDRKKAETHLQKSHLIIDSTSDAIISTDVNGSITFWNPGAERLYGYKKEEVLKKSISLLYKNDAIPVLENLVTDLIEGEDLSSVEFTCIDKDGNDVHILLSLMTIKDENQEIVELVGLIKDISELKKYEKEVTKQKEQSEQYLNLAGVIFVALNQQGEVTLINQKGCETLGCKRTEIIGKNWFENFIPSWQREELIPISKQLLSGNTEPVEYYENPILTKNGEERLIAWHNTILKDEAGNIMGHLSAGEDITQKRQLEAQLRQAQKMESVGSLAGGIAHEFNNILTIIIGNNELVMDELPEGSLVRENAEEIKVAGMRARDVVRQLLTFSRQDNTAMSVLNIRTVVQDSMKLIRSSTPASIEIVENLSDAVSTVMGNATQINQLLINLSNNAFDAMPNTGGVLTITTSNETIDGKQHLSLTPGDYVKLIVHDNGVGMVRETLEKVFDPFFTTKEVGKGSGIGLAVVHGIVERHNGTIEVESHPDHGTTFTIYMPIHDAATEEENEEFEDLSTGDERILFVDDEASIVKLGKCHLEDLGYTVISTTEPVQALEMVTANPEKFDIVISDMAMPKMTGDQLITEVLKVRPDMLTIICTGYSSKLSEQDAAEIGVTSFLMKPFDKAELSKVVRRVLDESKASGV